MKRYRSLFRDTWWLWTIFLLGGCIAGIFMPIFFVTIPICVFSFTYFGFMRYDKEGNMISEDQLHDR